MKEIQYTVTNIHGIIGFIVIKEINKKKIVIFVSFDNDHSFASRNFDVALMMQKTKHYEFPLIEDDEKIVLSVLNQSISGYDKIKDAMRYTYFIDDLTEKLAELKKAISQMKF